MDTLEFQEIVCNHNGQLRTLEEGVDYTVKEDGGFPGWKQIYLYHRKKKFSGRRELYSDDLFRGSGRKHVGYREQREKAGICRG